MPTLTARSSALSSVRGRLVVENGQFLIFSRSLETIIETDNWQSLSVLVFNLSIECAALGLSEPIFNKNNKIYVVVNVVKSENKLRL